MSVIDNNYNCLLTRTKNQLFYADPSGRLVELTGTKKLWYTISTKYRESIQKDVQTAISNVIKEMAVDVTNENRLTFLLFEKLSRLSTKVFDRSVIDQLSPDFVKDLAPEYAKYRQFFAEGFSITDITENPKYYKYAKAAIHLGLRLGIRPTPVGDGSSGTYFMKDLSDQAIGVFKPGDEEPLAKKAPKWTSQVKRIFTDWAPFFRTAVSCNKGNAYKSEVAASTVSRKLKLYNVPITKIINLSHPIFNYSGEDRKMNSLPPKTGSLQMFVKEKCESAEQSLKINRIWCLFPKLAAWIYSFKNSEARKLSNEEVEKMDILDFFNGNLDRHFGNWLVGESNTIYCIDNGFAFPDKHSDSWVSRLNQYIWKILPQAQSPFSENSKRIIRLLKGKKERIIEKLTSKSLINENQKKALEERIAILIHFVENNLTPFDLAQIKSTQDFQKFLHTEDPIRLPNEFQYTSPYPLS